MQQVTIEPFFCIGICVMTTNENGKGAKDIAELWHRFMGENILSNIPNKTDTDIYSLYTDYESDHTRPYLAILGCKVANLNTVPPGMVGKYVKGGNYVKLTAHGDLFKGLIADQWFKIWDMGLDRTFSADFEVFGAKAQNPTEAEVDFYIAVK